MQNKKNKLPVINQSFKIKNYKCFGEEEQGFNKIFPINIIIGKNNSGKSSLLDFILFLTGEKIFQQTKRETKLSTIFIEIEFKTNELNDLQYNYLIKNNNINAKENDCFSLLISVQSDMNLEISYILNPSKEEQQIRKGAPIELMELEYNFFNFKKVFKIQAERDIKPENGSRNILDVQNNGESSINALREIIQASSYDADIVNKELLSELNKIVNPDIEFKSIFVESINSSNWEIYFKDLNNNKIPLSNMGSGVKTILLVLINLIALPKAKNNQDELIFLFEELENNLHPALQRRLFNYILNYSIENKAYFFITTHSNIVIDLFSNNLNAQILHVRNLGTHSVVETVISNEGNKNILKDLDYKASDLLLSNGIIWVEGPSDAIYIELFLELYKKSIGEENEIKLSFTIQVLATAIWKYAGFEGIKWDEILEDNLLENKVIALQHLNHNHLLVIDKDNNYELNKKPSEWKSFTNGTGRNKARLIHKSLEFAQHNEDNLIGKDYSGIAKVNEKNILLYWINGGTMETYLEHFVTTKSNNKFSKYFKAKSTQHYFSKKDTGKDSSISKVELAGIIADYVRNNRLSFEDITVNNSDLKNKISRLYNTIKFWNE